jgi:hypothetical protein
MRCWDGEKEERNSVLGYEKKQRSKKYDLRNTAQSVLSLFLAILVSFHESLTILL